MDIQTKWFADEHPLNAVSASATIGAGDDGVVTVAYSLPGEEGNSYTVEVSDDNDGDDDAPLSAELNGTALVVYLGTDADATASTTIGSGTDGTVTIELDETESVDGNTYDVEVTEGTAGGSLSSSLSAGTISVVLGMGAASKASATIGSGTDGTVTIEYDTAGAAGNALTVEVINGEVYDAAFSDGAVVITVRAVGDSAESVANLINSEIGSNFTATASGTGETLLTTPEAEKNFAGGQDAAPDNAKNTATLVAASISTIDGVTATASGEGTAPLTEAETATFSGDTNSGDISTAKNTATLIAAAINEVPGFEATASGDGTSSITAAVAEQSLEGGVYGTVCEIPHVVVKDDNYYYINTAPNSIRDANWRRFTLASY